MRKVFLAPLIQGLEALVFMKMVDYGSNLQKLAEQGIRHGQVWAQGHFEDIGAIGAITSLALLSEGHEENKARMIAFGIPSIASFYEILQLLGIEKGTFDIQDIICYYGTALTAYGVNKLCRTYLYPTLEHQLQ